MKSIIGTAGWSVAREEAAHFRAEGTSLERYAARFGGAEINSSFHRSHRASTWQRWADSVPDGFRFSVKVPKTVTHLNKLAECTDLLAAFLEEVAPLGAKLDVLLVQLPPKLAWDAALVAAFFDNLQGRTETAIACEPRHASWFEAEADAFLAARGIARVGADPARVPEAAAPGSWGKLRYWRLHGSPVIYRSAYGAERLKGYAAAIEEARAAGARTWCIFDNTASSAATGDALWLDERLNG
jgi:uncharacterized protein YecE (DUF72 family)